MYRIVNADTMKTTATAENYGEACAFAKFLSDVHAVSMHVVSDTALHITYMPTVHI